MSVYLAVPLLLVLGLLQASVVSRLTIGGVHADLLLLFVASWGLIQGPREGVLWGFLGGLALELQSGAPFGATTLSYMLAGFLCGLGKGSVFAGRVVFPVGLIFVVTIAADLLFLAIVSLLPSWGSAIPFDWIGSLVRIILPSALMNAALMLPFLGAMQWAHRRLVRPEIGY